MPPAGVSIEGTFVGSAIDKLLGTQPSEPRPARPAAADDQSAPTGASGPVSGQDWLLLAALVVLLLVSRSADLGHLLTFDEAWDEQALRLLRDNVPTQNFFRHPPLYLILGRFVSGGVEWPALRLEGLTLALNAASLGTLFLLVRSTRGREAALWSTLTYVLMPGASLFDTWVKRDGVANLAGLLAIAVSLRDRPVAAGTALGLGFLGKETAGFYALAVAGVMLLRAPDRQGLRRLMIAGLTVVLVCGWWYAFCATGTGHFLDFFRGRTEENTRFAEPFLYYVTILPAVLGRVPLCLAVVGLAVAGGQVWRAMRARTGPRAAGVRGPGAPEPAEEKPRLLAPGTASSADLIWPVLLVLPALVVLSASRGKPLWLLIPLLPGLAALTGVGADSARRLLSRGLARLSGRAQTGVLATGGAAVLVFCLLLPRPVWVPYESRLRAFLPRMWAGALMSREIGEMAKRVTLPSDRLLITTFSYLSDSTSYCPVFLHYLRRRGPLPAASHYRTPAETLLSAAREQRLDWAILSPGPNPADTPLARAFTSAVGQRPIRLHGAVLFPLAPLHSRPGPDRGAE